MVLECRTVIYTDYDVPEYISWNVFTYNKIINDGIIKDIERSQIHEEYKNTLLLCLELVRQESPEIVSTYGYINFCLKGVVPLLTLFNTRSRYTNYHLVVNIDSVKNYKKNRDKQSIFYRFMCMIK